MDMRRKFFFQKISQIIGRFGQMSRINCGIFGAFPVEVSVQKKLGFISVSQIIWDKDICLDCKELGI